MKRVLALVLTACFWTTGAAAAADPGADAYAYYEARAVWSSKVPGTKRMFDIYWALAGQGPGEDGELTQLGGVGRTRCFSRDLMTLLFFCRPGGRIKRLPPGAFTIDPLLGSASLTVEGDDGTSTVEWIATGNPSNFHSGGRMWGSMFVSNTTSRPADAIGSILGVDPGAKSESMAAYLSLNISADVYE